MNINEVLDLANLYGIDFSKYTLEELLTGINIEMEHGLVNPVTNVTDDDLEKTFKIALAHLNEFPNYYNKEYGLPAFEAFLKDKMDKKY